MIGLKYYPKEFISNSDDYKLLTNDTQLMVRFTKYT